jgi:hypothetical protein
MMFNGFPNAYMCYTPHAPTALSNGPTIIEAQCDFIAAMITGQRERNVKSVMPTAQAQVEWQALINMMSMSPPSSLRCYFSVFGDWCWWWHCEMSCPAQNRFRTGPAAPYLPSLPLSACFYIYTNEYIRRTHPLPSNKLLVERRKHSW